MGAEVIDFEAARARIAARDEERAAIVRRRVRSLLGDAPGLMLVELLPAAGTKLDPEPAA